MPAGAHRIWRLRGGQHLLLWSQSWGPADVDGPRAMFEELSSFYRVCCSIPSSVSIASLCLGASMPSTSVGVASLPSRATIMLRLDDARFMFEFQQLLRRFGSDLETRGDSASRANAEQLAGLLLDPTTCAKVWPVFKASMPTMIVDA